MPDQALPKPCEPKYYKEGRLRELVASYWPTLEQLGLSKGALQERLTLSSARGRTIEAVAVPRQK